MINTQDKQQENLKEYYINIIKSLAYRQIEEGTTIYFLSLNNVEYTISIDYFNSIAYINVFNKNKNEMIIIVLSNNSTLKDKQQEFLKELDKAYNSKLLNDYLQETLSVNTVKQAKKIKI